MGRSECQGLRYTFSYLTREGFCEEFRDLSGKDLRTVPGRKNEECQGPRQDFGVTNFTQIYFPHTGGSSLLNLQISDAYVVLKRKKDIWDS